MPQMSNAPSAIPVAGHTGETLTCTCATSKPTLPATKYIAANASIRRVLDITKFTGGTI